MSDIPLISAEPLMVEQIEYHADLAEHLKQAYMAALAAQHIGWRTEIHVGSDVVAYLRSLALKVEGFIPVATMWGFPLVETTAAPDHISVHAVRTIA